MLLLSSYYLLKRKASRRYCGPFDYWGAPRGMKKHRTIALTRLTRFGHFDSRPIISRVAPGVRAACGDS
jgi:hypothetical protein